MYLNIDVMNHCAGFIKKLPSATDLVGEGILK